MSYPSIDTDVRINLPATEDELVAQLPHYPREEIQEELKSLDIRFNGTRYELR